MREYFKSTFILGIPNFIKLFSGIIKNKIIALILGTEGLGIVSMFSYAINTLIPLSTFGTELSMIKYSAESKTDVDAHRVLFTGMALILFSSLVLGSLLILFRESLCLWIFFEKKYLYAVIWVILAFPFYSLAEILIQYLKGRKFLTAVALGNSIIAILSLFIGIPMIYILKIKGGFLQILITGAISFLILSSFLFREKGIFRGIQKIHGFFQTTKMLVRAGFLLYFVPRIFYILTLFLVKIMIVKNFDFKRNGIFESVTLLSTVIFSFLSDTLMGYYLPTVCSNMKSEEKKYELNKAIRFIVLISVPTIVIAVNFIGKFLIRILFSKQFLLAFEFLSIRFIGDYFYLINSAITFTFVANSNYRGVLIVSVIYNGLILGLSNFFPMIIGFKGYFMAYLAAAFFVFIIISPFLKRYSVSIFSRNYIMVLFSALIMIVCLSLARFKYFQFLSVPILIIWLFFNFSIEELKGHWRNVLRYVRFDNNLKISRL